MQEVRDLLPQYADGELDAEQRATVEAALASDSGLQDELNRWQGLRRSANRGMTNATLPSGLQDRITASIRREKNRSNIMRLIVPLSAAAAVVFLAVMLQDGLFSSQRYSGGNAVAAQLAASDFVMIHQNCAVMKKHDPYDVRGDDNVGGAVANAVKCNTGLELVPSLDGYASTGCCGCVDRQQRVKGIHIYYEADGQAVVSLFVTDGLIHLLKNGEGDEVPQAYQLLQMAKTGMVKWDEKTRSYALVAHLQPKQLESLANQIRVASWMNSHPPLAMARSRK